MKCSRIIIRGRAAVFRDDEPIVEHGVLRSLDGLAYEDENFTDYIGGSEEEKALAAILEGGGGLRFGYDDGQEALTATTEYRARRPLTEDEIRLLIDYTMGQWSDGIGENWAGESTSRCGFLIMCLTPGDEVGSDYPSVEIVDDSTAESGGGEG